MDDLERIVAGSYEYSPVLDTKYKVTLLAFSSAVDSSAAAVSGLSAAQAGIANMAMKKRGTKQNRSMFFAPLACADRIPP